MLNVEDLPEIVPDNLKIIWDGIMKEYQDLTKRQDYTVSIRRAAINIEKHNRLNGLIACYHLMRYGVDVSEELSFWNVPNKFELLEQKILQERTRLNIEYLQNNKEKHTEDFDKLAVLVENSLNRNLDTDNISVKKWVYLVKSIEDKAKSLESLKHGRQNTSGRPISIGR